MVLVPTPAHRIGLHDGPIRPWSMVLHPLQEGGPEVEAHELQRVQDLPDSSLGPQDPGGIDFRPLFLFSSSEE